MSGHRAGGPGQRRIRTLLVDDEPALVRRLSGLLETLSEIEIVGTAGDGWHALELVESLQPELVLLDVHMPGLNGLEITGRVRRLFPAIRVIVVTALDGPEMRWAAEQIGAHGFLAKGALPSDLPEMVRRVFGLAGLDPLAS